ncbi:FAD binding domain-containing protein [Ferviditalea candida]|uniref:Xanthine dehydrogenase family protein subunit M n=1 Tax=Ferviditalea candida TaxID=3108399 RepID=A0ABU5ZE91_9BACL|nr:xanthine dehydrogenase family protein subunit M [Paenibacillaceae bacterium T2]
MKPARFSYSRPEQLKELFELLDRHADSAKIIAGGQSLVPMMNMRLARPEVLIDINRLTDLSYIVRKEERIEIGALTRQSDIEGSELLKEACPILPFAVGKIGHYAIRQRGTIGGSVVHADPSAELPVIASLLDANIHIASSEGERTVPAEEFFVTIYTTDLLPMEVVTSIDFPVLEAGEGWAYRDFTRRAGDYAIVSVGATMKLDEQGQVNRMRLALGGVQDIPHNVKSLLDPYLDAVPDKEWMHYLVEEITSELDANSDIHASSEDRIELLKVLIPAAVDDALQRAKGGEPVK